MHVVTQKFDSISLAELNAKAEMMTRRDNKYIMRIEALDRLAPHLTGPARAFIDSGLRIWHGECGNEIADGMVVLETKSRFGRGIADTILRGAGHHSPGSCSKYCLGLAALGRVPRFNKFVPAFNRLIPRVLPDMHPA